MSLRLVQFFTLILIALALVPAGAHLAALPNKIGLPQDQYFTVQAIYRGWALLGGVLIAAILASLVLTIMMRGQGAAFRLALGAFVLMAATLVIFFIWTFPANRATSNWTSVPANWETLRAQWEYAHATSAALIFVALCLAAWSVLLPRASAAG
jgi:hypothetical protein